jgi:hypothetical protein
MTTGDKLTERAKRLNGLIVAKQKEAYERGMRDEDEIMAWAVDEVGGVDAVLELMADCFMESEHNRIAERLSDLTPCATHTAARRRPFRGRYRRKYTGRD